MPLGARTIADIEAGTPLLMLRLTETLAGCYNAGAASDGLVPIGAASHQQLGRPGDLSQHAPRPFFRHSRYCRLC
jgi:hypothetical protein